MVVNAVYLDFMGAPSREAVNPNSKRSRLVFALFKACGIPICQISQL
jgi:hypothetical protein